MKIKKRKYQDIISKGTDRSLDLLFFSIHYDQRNQWVFDRFILHGNITGYDHTNGLIRVNYLTIQKEITSKNFRGDVVVGFE
ncbi:MAG: hypothetical protein WC865_14360 [Bacteroidales bacterium]